jgi:hypothetical protein
MIVVMSDATDLVDLVIEVFDPRKRRSEFIGFAPRGKLSSPV